MDPQLPAQLVQFLAPYLLKGLKLAGQETARKPGEKAGEQRASYVSSGSWSISHQVVCIII